MNMAKLYEEIVDEKKKKTLHVTGVLQSLPLGSFSNDDSEDSTCKKMDLYFTFECCNSVNLFSTPMLV